MPSKTLSEQTGNSCAAHCTVISIMELTDEVLSKAYAENNLWPKLIFASGNELTADLVAAKNSDPRLIASEVKKRWPGRSAKLLCDHKQMTLALAAVPEAAHAGLTALFDFLAHDASKAPVLLDEEVYYNCSYTMHGGSNPKPDNFTGFHNILVTYTRGEVYYYNPNETHPNWSTTRDWKILKGQNGNTASYVFTGMAVAIF